MRLVVVLDCLQPSAPVLDHRAGLPLGALGAIGVLVPDAGRADLVGQRVPEPRRARTAYT